MPFPNYPIVVFKRVVGFGKRVIGTRNERLLKRLRPRADAVDDLEPRFRAYTDEQLREQADRLRAEIRPLVEEFEAPYIHLSREQRRLHQKDYRAGLKKLDGKIADLYFHETSALIREASRRAQQHRHFNCQIIGGYVLYDGTIAEMKTGEGKTIVCHVAALLKVLQGKHVHVITANDYLVKRDAEFAQPIFAMLGITVGYTQSQVDSGGREGVRQAAYACDITFGTNSEFGFDYLRDNMKTRVADQVQGSLDYAIIDEVDSLLIDEARTPLIISGPAGDDVTRYPRADKVAADMVRKQNELDRRLRSIVAAYDGDSRNIPKLDDAMRILGYKGNGKANGESAEQQPAEDQDDGGRIGALGPDFLTDDQTEAIQQFQHLALGAANKELYYRLFVVQRDRKQAQITHEGVTFAQEALDLGSLYAGPNVEWPHLLENALRSHKVYERDKDYVVQNGDVVIVDQFTGRLMPGRQWSDGLHQAVEAKEGVRVKQETQTLATITIQNYAHLYDKVAGMTGTAATEATEFMKIYKLDVVEIPTNRPVNRVDFNDRVHRDVDEKYRAIVEEIHEIRRRGRPADPFVIAEVLAALRPIHERMGRDCSRIDAAIEQFNQAEYGDRKVIDFMLEVYDREMGDLATGRPVLVGTTSVENSEKLSRLLDRTYGIEHEVLNAKNHTREAEIITKTGYRTVPGRGDKTPLGNVTIATNMAGRGTDIKLGEGVVYPVCKVPQEGDLVDEPIAETMATGGPLPDGRGSESVSDASVSLPVIDHRLYPPGLTKCCIHCQEYDPGSNCARCYKPKLDPRFPELGRKVCPINVPCGLHIVGTERHEARRIDNQLRGRAGRQGDPGSSRFFLSLEDDLLKLFMPDWVLKMMSKHAFEASGAAIEMKQLTKGIEKAQRKVEERNFSTRKNLLEWDEPMDYQRKAFYDARQEVLEGYGLRDHILDWIDQAVEEAVGDFLSGDYNAQCIVDWCREDLQVPISASDVADQPHERVQELIRATAKDEARESIRRSIGEYVDPGLEPAEWDIGGLQTWVQRAYKVAVSKNQLRKMDADQITDLLIEAAEDFYDHVNLDGVVRFTDPDYPGSALAEWARAKFDLDFDSTELRELPTGEAAQRIADLIHRKYARREIEYPVDYTLARSVAIGGTNQALTAQAVLDWANSKYRVDWKPEHLDGRKLSDVRDELVKLNEEFLTGGRLEREVDRALADKRSGELHAWAADRFGPAWNQERFDAAEDPRQALLDVGRRMLTWELGVLEHRVVLQLYDQMWKDHLWEMDRLEDAIKQRPLGGDQTHPQSQYAIEGRELFDQMWSRLRGRIVELILKVRAAPVGDGADRPEPAAAGPPVQLGHADATGAGFSGAATDYEAAMRAQGGAQKVETIRRDKPKVGRNDPCPCGSGKKFKNCHGRK